MPRRAASDSGSMSDGRRTPSESGSGAMPHAGRKVRKQDPQKTMDDFWEKFVTKFPGKVHTILPKNKYAKSKTAHEKRGSVRDQAALTSYEEARRDCEYAVKKIAKECRRVNMRYRDPHFDIDFDLKKGQNDCLEGMAPVFDEQQSYVPKSVKRVPEMYENPSFYVEGTTASDVRQGMDGDCWFLSALCALSNKDGLVQQVCVARDEAVGVYGFVFHRDGEWIQCVIDDKLYLSVSDYDESVNEKFNWEKVFNRQDAEEEYQKAYQTGSRALYFAQCSNENETWLPLLEKAFAKAHGDYRAIDGGFTGEAIEDLTGGVTTELYSTDILDKDDFWKNELLQVNKQFLFGCATGTFDDWQDGAQFTNRKGIVSMHAYSIIEAVEIKGERLCKLRNPWGRTEWEGAWSDGSEQWTPEWMNLLNHRFGNDGVFWISYKDLLRKYQSFDRTRLFGPEWSVTQKWTSLDVPWTADYNTTKFSVTFSKAGPAVLVLSQLDDRYYKGLQGQYDFSLHFRLQKDDEDEYVVRSHGNYLMKRSVSVDLPDLEAGTYSVLMKITAKRWGDMPKPEETVRKFCRSKQEKLLQVGLAYDLAHAKGQEVETAEERKARLIREEKAKAIAKQKQREALRELRYKEWLKHKKLSERNKKRKQKEDDHHKRKAQGKAPGGGTGPPQVLPVDEGSASTQSAASIKATGDVQDFATPTQATSSTQIPIVSVEPAKEPQPPTLQEANAPPPTGLESSSVPHPSSAMPSLSSLDAQLQPSDMQQPASMTNAQAQSAPDTGLKESMARANMGETSQAQPPPIQTNGFTEPPPSASGSADLQPQGQAPGTVLDDYGEAIQGVNQPLDNEPRPDAPPATANNTLPPPSQQPLDAPDGGGGGGDTSDASSVLSFDSTIDSELDLDSEGHVVDNDAARGPPPVDDEDDDDAEFSSDPWNAVCVVGLRVFSRDCDVEVNVVKPKEGDEYGTKLDLDDPNKGASE
ncbi:hypothetical protein MMC25_003401 [Agyrium rufum]|nr:hypothetical protein [Agyrium rufum]